MEKYDGIKPEKEKNTDNRKVCFPFGDDENNDDSFILTFSQAAQRAARILLEKRADVLTPDDLGLIAKFISSAEKLPTTSQDLNVRLNIHFRNNDELKYIEFIICNDYLYVSIGGSINMGCGSDSYTDLIWDLELTGATQREGSSDILISIEDTLCELFNLGAEFEIGYYE